MRKTWAVILLLWLALPFVIALWWFFPLVVGVALWALWKFSDRPRINKFARPLGLFILLAFVIWCYFIPWKQMPHQSYEASAANRLVARPFSSGEAKPTGERTPEQVARQTFIDALARERLKVAKLRSSLDLYNSGDAIFVNRSKRGVIDTPGLGTALKELEKSLSAHKLDDGNTSPDLLDPAMLRQVVASAEQALKMLEVEALKPDKNADQILDQRNQIPRTSRPFRLTALFTDLQAVENALRVALNADIRPTSSYSAEYDRASDALVFEQRNVVGLGNQPATAVDLEGVFLRAHDAASLEVSLQEDNGPPRTAKTGQQRLQLRPETKTLVVVQRVRDERASRQLLTRRLWIPFRVITVDWPVPLVSSIELHLQFLDDPGVEWPMTVNLTPEQNAAVTQIRIPRYSLYFADAAVKTTTTTQADELSPETSAPKLAEMAAGKPIQIELLPFYLSHSTGQKLKEYLVMENAFAALIVSIVTSVILALFSPKQ